MSGISFESCVGKGIRKWRRRVDKTCIKFHEFILSLEPQNISEISEYDKKQNEINLLNYDLYENNH